MAKEMVYNRKPEGRVITVEYYAEEQESREIILDREDAENIEYMKEALHGCHGADTTSYWGGALMLLNTLKANGHLEYELVVKLEEQIRQEMEA